ncbi:MAG: hypothetical protein HY799_03315 [Nitrosomonadales bacterium]|nr:hypothetical protein [Nitrosomonadales bacterium]
MTINSKQTSGKVASLAAQTLQDNNASHVAKQLAGAALAQAGTHKQTGKEMETLASKVMQSEKYSDDTKTLAATVLSQSNKAR